jgi:hypothetical protein
MAETVAKARKTKLKFPVVPRDDEEAELMALIEQSPPGPNQLTEARRAEIAAAVANTMADRAAVHLGYARARTVEAVVAAYGPRLPQPSLRTHLLTTTAHSAMFRRLA